MRKVKILSIKKNVINIKVRSTKLSMLVPLCMATTIMFMLLFSLGDGNIKQVGSNMAYIYSPVNSLYNDNSGIAFASAMLDRESVDFVLPMSGTMAEIGDNGDIYLWVNNSIMVKSCESGVVDDIGVSLDGIKYIKIRHCLDMYSIVENVNIVGVAEGDIVKKGQDIATAVEGERITLKLYSQDKQISNIKINQSKILWEN